MSTPLPVARPACMLLQPSKTPFLGALLSDLYPKIGTAIRPFVITAMLLFWLVAPAQAGFSDTQIAEITQDMEAGIARCSNIDATYQIDCYRRVYERASQDLKGQRLQADAQKSMRRTAVELKRLVRTFADPAAPKIQVAGKTVSAINRDSLPKAAARARAILQETETYLLRGRSQAAQHYQRIAAVVNSSKVLIRSS